MKKFASLIILSLSLASSSQSIAQHIPVDITIDTSFGHGGKIEINTDGFNNEATAFTVNFVNKVTTVCGKVSTASTGAYHLGMVRIDSTGKPDSGFGTGGIANFSWGTSDYPNAMQPYSDSSGMYILAGASGTNSSLIPALYRFKKNGTPDSSFGSNGRLTMPFAENSGGEAVHIDISSTQYVVCGKSTATEDSGKTGFGVMSINWDGTLDTTFSYLGYKSRMVIPALVHSVQGFFLNDRRFFLCGISDTGKRELLFARFTEKRVPDSSVGVNGLIHTGIILTGDTLFAQLESGDNKIVMVLPTPQSSPTHLMIRRFDAYGVADSSYGNKGIGKNGIGINDILPSFQPKGIFIAGDFSEIISGMVNAEHGSSIFLRISDTTARPDPIFNHTGIISIDIDSGVFSNYLKFVQPIGKVDKIGNIKRFIGVGGSIHNGVEHFMIARFIGHPTSSVRESNSGGGVSLSIYPNPVSSLCSVEIKNGAIKNLRIIDALGREVLLSHKENYSSDAYIYSLDASKMTNGIYYCIARSDAEQVVRKFIVMH